MKVLVLCPHTDDEYNCSGTMVRWMEEGHDLYYVAFSTARQSSQIPSDAEDMKRQNDLALTVLGIPEKNRIIYDWHVRRFPDFRQEILDDMIRIRSEIYPDVVLCPSTRDIHQDHEVICREAQRAFKYCSIYGYEVVWNSLTMNVNMFVEITEDQLQKKVNSFLKYYSQKHRPYFDPDVAKSMARTRGIQSGCLYAEAFEVIRKVERI